MILTGGFQGDFRAHNVRKGRGVKCNYVYGQIKAAGQ